MLAGRLIESRERSKGQTSDTPRQLRAEDRIRRSGGADRGCRIVSLPCPRSEGPVPSMKNGRFSEKNSGKRWLTSTWNASDSTWLKSGLTVASTRDRRRDAVLSSSCPRIAHVVGDARNRSGSRARLACAIRRRRNDLRREPPFQCAEPRAPMPLEAPTGRYYRPATTRHPRPADAAPEQHIHADVRAAPEAHGVKRHASRRRSPLHVRRPALSHTKSGDAVLAAGVRCSACRAARPLWIHQEVIRLLPGPRASRLSPTQSSCHTLSRRVMDVVNPEGLRIDTPKRK